MMRFLLAFAFIAFAIAQDIPPMREGHAIEIEEPIETIMSRMGIRRNSGIITPYNLPYLRAGVVRPVGPQIRVMRQGFSDTVDQANPTNQCQCQNIYKPVCASNSQTYQNECIMNLCSGYEPCQLKKLFDGPCGYKAPQQNFSPIPGPSIDFDCLYNKNC